MKWHLKFWSLALVLAMLCNVLPAVSFAQGLQEIPSADAEATVQPENVFELTTTGKEPSLSGGNGSSEVIALREENIKHYDMGNGTFQAIAYSHPVHELDSDGNWQDIDFGLTLTGTRSSRMYANEKAGAAFAENYVANQPIMTLSSKENAISMSLITTNVNNTTRLNTNSTVAAEVTNPQNLFQTIEDAKSADFSSKILYKEVLPGVDLEYIVDPGTVKENIIVNEKATTYQYSFALNLTGLYPVMQDDGSIIVYDQDADTKEYEIPAPFMYDALGNVSEDVAGKVFTGSEETYYKDTLGFTSAEYTQLKSLISSQHSGAPGANEGDFAHMQITLAARLAHYLDIDGLASNIAGDDETVAYLAGWLGDATLTTNGTTSFGNDDYIADLDAENIYRQILQAKSITLASDHYYSDLSSATRAQIFTGYISYATIKESVYYELIDKELSIQIAFYQEQGDFVTAQVLLDLLQSEEYHEETIEDYYPDTHDFLYSIYNMRNTIYDY